MNPNSAAEQPPQKSMQEQIRAAVEQAIEQARASYDARNAEINNIQNEQERIMQRAALQQEYQRDFQSRFRQQIEASREAASQSETQQAKQEKAAQSKHIILEAKALGDAGVKVFDTKSQQVVNKIVEYIKNGQITDQGALVLERNIGQDLINGIVFSKKGESPSDFEKNLRISYEADPIATAPLLRDLGENQDIFGYEGTPKDLLSKIGMVAPENEKQQTNEDGRNNRDRRIQFSDNPEINGELNNSAFVGELSQYYLSRFTGDQIDLIKTFYSPTAFVDYMERLSSGDDQGGKNFFSKAEVQEKREKIKNDIKKYFEKNPNSLEPGENPETLLEKQWGQEVSKRMEWNVSDVINQLFLELQQKSPNKFYEQIMQEDIFQGPAMIQKRIQAAINSLMTKMEQVENSDNELAKRMKKLHLYQQDTAESYVMERGQGVNKKIYPRLHPFSFAKDVGPTDFIRHLYMTIDQTISKAEYFHNSRAIYGHPPGEKGFYAQLGDFAEQMKGGGIDEILMLPDGQYMMESYQLYEKMLQEDFAQMDHRHRPDQLSNKLERVNPQIVIQVFEQLRQFYPELSDERLWNIVNSGVGISRGIFLTESEKSAYADPIDSEGKGMVASYSTNDAGSLNVFNPMHTILRWQGEHNMNLMYFMPVKGEPGPWDHHKAMNNAAKYMDALLVGKGRGQGKDMLPETFADAMMDIGNVGGPGKRKGWRTKYSLESHFVYDDDGTIDAPKTFKAMEAIGYEAIFNFYTTGQAGPEILKATESSDLGQVKERRELFKYIYERYFHEGDKNTFQESEFDSYMAKLKEKGEAKLLDKIKNNKSLPIQGGYNQATKKFDAKINASYDEMVAFETSQLFLENTLAHYVATRFPTIFLRMDKNRLHDNGISHWEEIWREFRDQKDGWKREDFDKSMKDLTMAEMLLRRQISEKARNNINLDKKWTLDKFDDYDYRLNETKIRELLSKNSRGEDRFKSEKEIDNAIKVFQHMKDSFHKNDFLNDEAYKRMKSYTFTFGLEDTDISLMNFRGTGPRMVARAIKDVASAEQTITPWILHMYEVLNEIAINGKNDFSPIIEYMRKAQKTITDINGVPDTYEHMYKMAGTIINYFKKDGMAKPLFGLFGLGKKNSLAAEYSGRSGAVWEWDSRDIDRFCIALESTSLLKNNPYDLQPMTGGKKGGQLEDRWIKIPGIKKPIKFNLFGKKRHVDYEYNSLKLRREHGADWKAITFEVVNEVLPLVLLFIMWQYIKKALEEVEGKKK